MGIAIRMGLTGQRAGGGFNPASLIGAGQLGAYHSAFPPFTTQQDSAGTIPNTAPAQPVGRSADRGPNGTHATQSTSAAQPTLSRWPKGGRRNFLTWTEDFSNAACAKVGAPTTTAGKIILDTGTSGHRVAQSALFEAGLQTVEVEAAAAELSFLRIRLSVEPGDTGARPGSSFAFYNLGAGTVATVSGAITSNGGTATMTDLGGGFYRCRLTFRCTVAGTINVQLYPKDADTANDFDSWTPASVGGIFARRVAAVQSATPIAYQRVTTARDVTETGVPDVWYWFNDGGDSLPLTLTAGTYTRARVSALGVVTFEDGLSLSGSENILRVAEQAEVLYRSPELTTAEKAALTAYWTGLTT